ncbi:MAG: class I SAM-dependent methyltransferase [Lewinella sp.]|uniref:class I SAM-dependent methyltransferase n=1 Tax=Lewinella sp. TaxID=2004506 RepID=UPI003D6B31C5
MAEFWETSFRDKKAMWGLAPADCVMEVLELFKREGVCKILIPGFGYGRNAKIFMDNGFDVTGIEISATAIGLAKEHFGDEVKVHHGAVGEMPFDEELYEGIFCYALIHLLDSGERAKLINDCYAQLAPGGYMVFVAISTHSAAYGEGKELSTDRFETKHGVQLFFYDQASVEREFGEYGLMEAKEISEPAKIVEGKPYQRFWQINCKKNI